MCGVVENHSSRSALSLVVSIAAVLGAGCGPFESATPPDVDDPSWHAAAAAPSSPADPALSSRRAPPAMSMLEYDDAASLAWLTRRCASCHAPNASGRLEPTWPMPPVLTREWLEVTEATTVAYELLRKKLREPGASGYPSPMPLGDLDAEGAAELEHVVAWFERRLPFTVADADVVYHRKPNALPRPPVAPACTARATLRGFVSRLTLAALNRAPTAAELGGFAPGELDAGVTAEQRALLVSRLSTVWKSEFTNTGLRKLAGTIATAGTIPSSSTAPIDGAPDRTFPGASDELYELVKAHYDDWDYPRYFTENVVMANPSTAPLYGCTVSSGWAECALKPPRTGFFTTIGYLSSLPQSFMRLENNSRRYAGVHMTLVGETHARTGVLGPPVTAQPDCIDATDLRYLRSNAQAPWSPDGVMAALQMGQICQSCHLRGMAAGQVLFRPFASGGEVYDAATLGAAGSPDAQDYQVAVGGNWGYARAPGGAIAEVDGAFLQSLLAARKACVSTGDPARPFQSVADVNDLVRFMMRDRDAVARGFVRHAHRVFSTVPLVTLEMEARALAAFDSGHATMADLVRAYFMSDSFSCDVER